MTDQKIVTIGTSTANEVAGAALLFGRKFDNNFDWIINGGKMGFHKANTVSINGVPSYVVVWHLSDQKTFCVNAVAELPGHVPDFSALIEAFHALARRCLATAIEGITVRAGMVKMLMENGFKPAGVCMVCPLK